MKLNYARVTVFDSRQDGENPVTCFYLPIGQTLEPELMLSVAQQHAGFGSEAVFCTPLGNGTFTLSFLSSGLPVDFCWPSLIGCMSCLFGNTSYGQNLSSATVFAGTKGRLTVYRGTNGQDEAFHPVLEAVDLQTHITPEAVAGRLGLLSSGLCGQSPIRTVNAGQISLLVPVADKETLLGLAPETGRLGAFLERCSVDLLQVFTMQAGQRQVLSRTFAPQNGSDDFASVSGISAMAHYMQNHDLWRDYDQCISLEHIAPNGRKHNSLMQRRNDAVLLGGGSTVQSKGQHILP